MTEKYRDMWYFLTMRGFELSSFSGGAPQSVISPTHDCLFRSNRLVRLKHVKKLFRDIPIEKIPLTWPIGLHRDHIETRFEWGVANHSCLPAFLFSPWTDSRICSQISITMRKVFLNFTLFHHVCILLKYNTHSLVTPFPLVTSFFA